MEAYICTALLALVQPSFSRPYFHSQSPTYMHRRGGQSAARTTFAVIVSSTNSHFTRVPFETTALRSYSVECRVSNWRSSACRQPKTAT